MLNEQVFNKKTTAILPHNPDLRWPQVTHMFMMSASEPRLILSL